MQYYTSLFSPETYATFTRSSQNIAGFRLRQKAIAQQVKPGDILLCYVTRLSRWCGLLEIVDGPFEDSMPIFSESDDSFVVRFHVRLKTWLPLEHALPIHEDCVWEQLSFTRQHDKKTSAWTGVLRMSLNKVSDKDGKLLEKLLLSQAEHPVTYALNDNDQKKLKTHTVNRIDKVVSVSVPEDRDEADESNEADKEAVARESIKIQSLLAQIGARMGMGIWIPKADHGGVLKEWKKDQEPLLEKLPLNYDDVTLRTIEQIDVLWLRGRSIVRAFEVEHTTAVYSGILRMADLLALQPNMNIKLHIVAPEAKREKVFKEIRRPVFSLLEKGPLAESCTYISYDSLRELGANKHLQHMADTILDDYAEEAEEL